MAAVAAMANMVLFIRHRTCKEQAIGCGYCGMLLMLISRGLQEGVEDEP